jgi:hypothetical protein
MRYARQAPHVPSPSACASPAFCSGAVISRSGPRASSPAARTPPAGVRKLSQDILKARTRFLPVSGNPLYRKYLMPLQEIEKKLLQINANLSMLVMDGLVPA